METSGPWPILHRFNVPFDIMSNFSNGSLQSINCTGIDNKKMALQSKNHKVNKKEYRIAKSWPASCATLALSTQWLFHFLDVFCSAESLSETTVTHRPQGVIIVGIYMSSKYLLLLSYTIKY